MVDEWVKVRYICYQASQKISRNSLTGLACSCIIEVLQIEYKVCAYYNIKCNFMGGGNLWKIRQQF